MRRLLASSSLLTLLALGPAAGYLGADTGADGAATTVDDAITTTTPDVLVSVVTATLSTAHTHICVVNASAEVSGTSGDTLTIFGLSMDTTATTVAASERRAEQLQSDPEKTDVVSTTYAFTGVSGSHTFYFSARKYSAALQNANVVASSMTVVCTNKVL